MVYRAYEKWSTMFSILCSQLLFYNGEELN